MKFKALTALAGVLAVTVAGASMADPVEDDLVINGDLEIVTKTAAPEHLEYIDEVMSGWLFREDDTRDMERDDFDNPGMLGVEAAMDTWDTVEGTAGKACSDCHGALDDDQLVGVKAVYPKWNEDAGAVMTIEQVMNVCRSERLGAVAWGYNSTEMIYM